jgi:diadenosine tetraphosphate (Ap4A) HIT family hydrolase
MTDYERLRLKEFRHWRAYLHESQAYLGRLYLAAVRDDDVDFLQMTLKERQEFLDIGRRVKAALRGLFQPDRINYAALSNTWNHLHVHIIPRYQAPRVFDGITFTDPRPTGAPWPYDKEFRIPEATLLHIRDELADLL